MATSSWLPSWLILQGGSGGRGQRICFYRHYYYFLVYPQTLYIIFRHPLLTGKMKKWQPPGLMRKVKYYQRCRVSRDMFRLEDWKKGVKIIDGSTKYFWRKGTCGRSHVRNRGLLRQWRLNLGLKQKRNLRSDRNLPKESGRIQLALKVMRK